MRLTLAASREEVNIRVNQYIAVNGERIYGYIGAIGNIGNTVASTVHRYTAEEAGDNHPFPLVYRIERVPTQLKDRETAEDRRCPSADLSVTGCGYTTHGSPFRWVRIR